MRASLVVLVLLALAAPARAFPTGDRFDVEQPDPMTGLVLQSANGDGIRFTGSPDFPQATCASCHVNPPRLAGAHLGADPPSLFTEGYESGRTYLIEVQLTGETLGLEYNGTPRCKGAGVGCNTNGYALEVDDEDGGGAGDLCPSDPSGGCPGPRGTDSLLLTLDGHQVIASRGYLDKEGALPAGLANGATRWRFYWTAPPAGTGPVTFHFGIVDGAGGHGDAAYPQAAEGDDVVEAHVAVADATTATGVAGPSCATGGRAPRAVVPLALLVIVLGILRRRWRRT